MTQEQFEHFQACLAEGTSPSLAEMFALGQPPQSKTDKEFLAGFGANGSQFEDRPEQGDFYAEEARRQGVDVTGAVYLSGLAAFPGDPRAWIRGRGDAQRLCEERGWGCQGDVNVPLTRVAEPTGGGLAEDLIAEEMASTLEQVPPEERASVDTQELREQVIASRGPYWAKKER